MEGERDNSHACKLGALLQQGRERGERGATCRWTRGSPAAGKVSIALQVRERRRERGATGGSSEAGKGEGTEGIQGALL